MNIVWAMKGVKRPARAAHLLLLGVLCYLFCRGMLVVQLLPRWQGADEPGHVEMAALVARHGWPQDIDPGLQAKILADMQATRFFSWLDVAAPAEPLTGFGQIPRLADAPSQVGDESPVGYLPFALVAAAGGPDAPAVLLPRLRWAALALALLWVLALYWTGSRLGGGRLGAGLAAAAAFLPLGGLASATAGPDLVPALWAALWLGCLPRQGQPRRRGARWAAVRLAMVGLAAAAKRSGLFLVPLALACEVAARRNHPADPDRPLAAGLPLGPVGRLLAGLMSGALISFLVMGRASVAADWRVEGLGWGAVRLAAAARSGGHGFRVADHDPAAWQYLLRWVDLPATRGTAPEVEVGAWLRAMPGQAPAPAQMVATDGRGAWWGETVVAGTDWSPLTLRFTLPPGVDRLRLALVPGTGTAAGRGSFDVDDVVVRVDGQVREVNGGAEDPERWGTALMRGMGRYLAAPRLLQAAAAGWRDPLTGVGPALRGLGFLLRSAWGGFGWLKAWPGPWAAALGASLGLFMVAAATLALARPRTLALGAEDSWWLRVCGAGALAALLVATIGSMAGAADRLPQGRYLLPSYPFFVLPGLLLAERLLPGRGPWLFVLLLLALDLWTLLGILWPAFGGAA